MTSRPTTPASTTAAHPVDPLPEVPEADAAAAAARPPAGWRQLRRRPAAWTLFLGVSVLSTLVFLLSTNAVVMLTMEIGVGTASTVVLGVGWWHGRRPAAHHDPLVGLVFLSLLLYTLATAGFAGGPILLGVTAPVPSVVDAMYFLSYLLAGIFLWQLGSRSQAHGRRQYLDTLIVALGAMPIVWVRLVEPQLTAGPVSAVQLTYLAYPAFVSVLLGLTIRMAFRAQRLTTPYVLLGGWIGLELVADLVFLDTGISGTYVFGQHWQALWVLSAGCIGALALHPAAHDLLQVRVSTPLRGRSRLYILGGALTGPMVTLAVADEMPERADRLCLIVGLVLIIAVCLRLSGLMVDVAEQRRGQQELRRLSESLSHQASHDSLTGLANRTLLNERLASRTVGDADARTSVLLLDVDDFKLVNDSLGHEAGDQLLREIAERIQRELRVEDRGGRLGGDEFVVILEHADVEQAQALADRLLESLARPMLLGKTEVSVSVSIGIATSDQVQGELNLLGAADMAMYLAKQRGKAGSAVFEPEMQQMADERLRLEVDLRRALRDDELFLVYQPIVDLATGALAGVEALVRWPHKTHGLVSPEVFIPIAERTGLIVPLGAWVLRESVAQLQRWDLQAPVSGLVMNVNVSTRQLERPELLAVVDELIADGLAPSRLVLEITETALTLDGEAASDTLHRLRARGVRLAVDDFGTGYSSLSRLQAAPVTQLKIDRSFVNEIQTPESLVPIIHATVAMSDGLGLGVIAEGIETRAQLQYLRRLGCAHAQGYLLARPQDPAAITRLFTGALPWAELFELDTAGGGTPLPRTPSSRTPGMGRQPRPAPAAAPARDLQPGEVIRIAEAVAAAAAAEVAADAVVTAQAAVTAACAAAALAADKAERVAARAADAAAEAARALIAAELPPLQHLWETRFDLHDLLEGDSYTVDDAARDVATSRASEAASAVRKVAARVESVAAATAAASAQAAGLVERRLAEDAAEAACAVVRTTPPPSTGG